MENLSQNIRQKKQLVDEALLHCLDRRQYVHQSQFTKLPYNCIGLIRFRMVESPDQESHATGCLISENIVLTSAHSFMSIDTKIKTLLTLEPYQFCIDLHLKERCMRRGVISWSYAKEYKKIQEKRSGLKSHQKQKDQELHLLGIQFDYAMIKLSEPLRRQAFPKLLPNFKQNGKKVSVCGFNKENIQFKQMIHTNILQYWKYGGAYNIDTEKGQSGSPVFFMSIPKGHRSELKKQTYVVGVHKGCDLNKNRNICTLISAKVVKDLDEWSRRHNITFSVEGKVDYSSNRKIQDEPFSKKVEKIMSFLTKLSGKINEKLNLFKERIKYYHKQLPPLIQTKSQKSKKQKKNIHKPQSKNGLKQNQNNQKTQVKAISTAKQVAYCITVYAVYLFLLIFIINLISPTLQFHKQIYFGQHISIDKVAIASDQSVVLFYDTRTLTSTFYDPYNWNKIQDDKYKLEPHVFLNFYRLESNFGIIYITDDYSYILLRKIHGITYQQQVLFRGKPQQCLVSKFVVSDDGKMWAAGCIGLSKIVMGSIQKPRNLTIINEILVNSPIVGLIWRPKTYLLTFALQNNQTGLFFLGTINGPNSQIVWFNECEGKIMSILYISHEILIFLEKINSTTVLNSYNFKTKEVKKYKLHNNFTKISFFGKLICLQTNTTTFLYESDKNEYLQDNYFFKTESVIQFMGPVPGASFFFSKPPLSNNVSIYKMRHKYMNNFYLFYSDSNHQMERCALQCNMCLFESSSCVSCADDSYLTPQRKCLSCNSVMNNCAHCSNSSVCLHCYAGYILIRSTCVRCTDIVQNCKECQLFSQKCGRCLQGFYLSGGVCKSCLEAMEGCESCSSRDKCQKCMKGWVTVDGKCMKRSQQDYPQTFPE